MTLLPTAASKIIIQVWNQNCIETEIAVKKPPKWHLRQRRRNTWLSQIPSWRSTTGAKAPSKTSASLEARRPPRPLPGKGISTDPAPQPCDPGSWAWASARGGKGQCVLTRPPHLSSRTACVKAICEITPERSGN